MNGKCCMNVFTTFLRATKQGTYEVDKIYVGDITPELIDSYIEWRRDIKQNGDEFVLTPKGNNGNLKQFTINVSSNGTINQFGAVALLFCVSFSIFQRLCLPLPLSRDESRCVTSW